MGVQLGMMARRAADEAVRLGAPRRRIIGVSRFSDAGARERLERAGVETVPCDLLDRAQVERLPPAPNVVFMAGRKFGTTGGEPATWAANALMPANVLERYPASRIAAFSTACVYPFTFPGLGGSREEDPLSRSASTRGPPSAGTRLRMGKPYPGTPVCLMRLSYAIDLRYGVLRDVAEKVHSRRPVDLSVPCANVIWQGDAIAQALLLLELASSPPAAVNVSGPETVSIRRAAEAFGRAFAVARSSRGLKAPRRSWRTRRRRRSLGYPRVPLDAMIAWTADWVSRGMRSLGKPTHFESSDGRF
jgi:nucleoside-diphosphate-sugar epimerase